ncbi:MAG TPA: pantoate kinase [Methanofastidiosum sp.]|nr:pantoate kinase [Methanofastidiosum sp.]HNU60572.1 pantoate kinase [Methanofastidiosum sp.]HOI76653.1 pantoate kinase [Methanofastidiosum sp.]
MYNSEYYVPSHITGFFVPFFSEDYLKTGSTGAGVSLSSGLKTRIKIIEGGGKVDVFLNGSKAIKNNTPVSLKCLNIIKEKYPKYFFNKDVIIEHESDVPIGSGFGASASAALGICFSIKDLIKISPRECIRIAHEAEVKSLSGLGDVVAEVKGGAEIRKTPGVDGIIENIPSDDLKVMAISLGKKKTESVLKDSEKMKIIEKCGSKLLKRLISEPNIERLMQCSKTFTYKTGIMSQEILDLVKIVGEVNSYDASGIMIGEGAFTFINKEDENRVLESIIDIKGDIIVSPIASGLL